jgi:hypothetical protein
MRSRRNRASAPTADGAAGALAYGLGTVALGAQSIGHEYSHDTVYSCPSLQSGRSSDRSGPVRDGRVLSVVRLAIVNNGELMEPPWHTSRR